MDVPQTTADQPQLDDDALAVLSLLAEGLSIAAVASRLGVSPRTVRRRSRAICQRLEVAAPIAAAVWAAHQGLL